MWESYLFQQVWTLLVCMIHSFYHLFRFDLSGCFVYSEWLVYLHAIQIKSTLDLITF
jgi:hypothetical protein